MRKIKIRRKCPACGKTPANGLPFYNHVRAHVRHGELVEREINGKKVFMLPAEANQAEGLPMFDGKDSA